MKKLTTYVLFTFFSISNLFGQNYLNETSQWYEIRGDFFDKWISFSNQQILKDTIINNKIYLKVLQTSDYVTFSPTYDTLSYSQEIISTWYLREDSSKLYRLQNGIDKLIVDFNLEVGDPVGDSGDFQNVIEIDSVYFQNEFRKVYKTNYGNSIYEGIAGSKGLKYGVNYIGVEAFGEVICYSQNGETIVLYDEPNIGPFYIGDTCKMLESIPTSSEVVHSPKKLKIYPNPVQNKFMIKSEEIILAYQIYDTCGRIIKTEDEINNSNLTCDLSSENDGLYFIEIKTKNSIFTEKVLKM